MDNSNLKDHKQIGQELELFFTHEYAPGAPFWLPKGMIIFKELERFIRELTKEAGYLETSTPIMVKTQLFRESGHWEKFGADNMYNLTLLDDKEIDRLNQEIADIDTDIKKKILNDFKVFTLQLPISDKEKTDVDIIPTKDGYRWAARVNYTLKPMNCPESTILYRFRPRSYKELPLRLSELGRLHRREESGEVNGLLRVRQITMDDAHIYATEDQIFDEVSNILDMMMNFYKLFGFEYDFRFATRPDQRAGTNAMWDKAEEKLAEALKKKSLKAGDKLGDGAFYGPKIDVHIKDSQGREWQLATVQLDFHQPEAFKLVYIDKDGTEKRPVMIHRAIFGSFERFIGILTEHYQGKFPLWLSPVQVVIIPIADRHADHANTTNSELITNNLRSVIDDRSESMQAKIRDATLQKVPYMGIIGDREIETKTISVRGRDGKDYGSLTLSQFLKKLQDEIDKKA